jgi:hypothetical protein
LHEGTIIASAGRAPAANWLAAYVQDARRALSETVPVDSTGAQVAGEARASATNGSRAGQHAGRGAGDGGDTDTAWVDLAAWDLVLLVGRPSRPLVRHDQLRLAALARVADARWADLAERDARLSHPSRLAPVGNASSATREGAVPPGRKAPVPAANDGRSPLSRQTPAKGS